MKLFIIAAVFLMKIISAHPVMVPASETTGGRSPHSECRTISPKEQSMKCMCVVAYEERYDPLENMFTRSAENVMDVLLASCRLTEDAEMVLEDECYQITSNPLLDDLLLLQQGQLPTTMEYNPGLGVDLSWVEDCLNAVLG